MTWSKMDYLHYIWDIRNKKGPRMLSEGKVPAGTEHVEEGGGKSS